MHVCPRRSRLADLRAPNSASQLSDTPVDVCFAVFGLRNDPPPVDCCRLRLCDARSRIMAVERSRFLIVRLEVRLRHPTFDFGDCFGMVTPNVLVVVQWRPTF